MKYALEGVEAKKLTFELIKRGDLLFFEGPILSHFLDERGHDYLMRWCEMDETANRWLLLMVSKEEIGKHLSGKTSLLSLIQKTETGLVYFLDIDNDIEYKHIKYVEVGEIPEEYLPEKDSFFEMKYGTPYARQLEAEIKEQLDIVKHSFIETAAKKLFPKSKERMRIFDSNHVAWRAVPNAIDEQLVARMLIFPLMVHYHESGNRHIEELLLTHTHAFVNPFVCRQYLQSVTSFLTTTNINPGEDIDVVALLDRVIVSTEVIVKEHPKDYGSLFEDWKQMVRGECETMISFNRNVDTVFHFSTSHGVERGRTESKDYDIVSYSKYVPLSFERSGGRVVFVVDSGEKEGLKGITPPGIGKGGHVIDPARRLAAEIHGPKVNTKGDGVLRPTFKVDKKPNKG